MKRFLSLQYRLKCSRRSPVVSLANQGFTLTEVLVVLAIMVILFGMLFVPITSSIEATSTAQHRSQMNQTMRLAMEQIRRELSDAVGIYLPEYIPLPGNDGTAGTADDEYLINYSNITFAPPERYASGQVALPVRPREDDVRVRYVIHTPGGWPEDPADTDLHQIGGTWQRIITDAAGIHYLVPPPAEPPADPDHPFVLYRQEAYMNDQLIAGRNLFGSPRDIDIDHDGTVEINVFVVGLPLSENAMTPVREADIPVTDTVLLDTDGYVQIEPGYVKPGKDNFPDRSDSGSWSDGARTIYLHGGIQFTPLRVEGERIRPGANQTVYTARHGNWLGLHNPTTGGATYSIADALWWAPPGALPFPSFPALINSSELRPRIVVKRDNNIIVDTDGLSLSAPEPLTSLTYDLRWNSPRGTVSVWLPPSGPAQAFAVFNLTTTPMPPDPGVNWTVSYPQGDLVGSSFEYTKSQERRKQTDGEAFAGTSWIPMSNADDTFNDGEAITIDPGGIAETATIQTASGSGLQLTSNLANTYPAGTWVKANERSAKAPSVYTVTPQPALAVLDKMIVPASVRVWAQAYDQSTDQQYTLEYVSSVADPPDLGYGQFQLVETAGAGSGNWCQADIRFADSSGQVPPPSPEDPRTYGAPSTFDWTNLTNEVGDYFYILVQYQYRRNFGSPNVNDYDIIEVSYSTREVYNIALEVMPYRYLEEVATGVWRPHGPATGVQMRAQVEVRNLSR